MGARACGLSALVYGALTAILGRHVLAQAGSTIANDPGDPLLTAAILHWNAWHLPWSETWWQFPIFHPTRDALAFSEHLLGLSVIASPIAWITGNPLTAYNLTLLLTFPLSALAMYALVYRLAGAGGAAPDVRAMAAFVAGLAYGFAPYRMSNLPHIQMLAAFWAPLALVGLHAFLDTGRRRWLALYGAAWALQAASNWYSLVFLSVLVGCWVLWFVVAPRRWRALAAIGAATIAAAVPLVPLVVRYASTHAVHGFERNMQEIRLFSADVGALLCAPSSLTVWGWVRVACRGEGELFPGVAVFALCAAAAWLAVRRTDDTSGSGRVERVLGGLRTLLLVVAVLFGAVVLSVLVAGPWAIEIGPARISASTADKPFLVALAAAVSALLLSLGVHAARPSPPVASFYLAAAVVTWTCALGPTLTLMGEVASRPGPFALLQWLPGVDGLRAPARFWMMTVLCLAAVVGLMTARILHARTRWRGAVLAALAVAIVADGWAAPIPAQPPPAAVPDPSVLAGEVVLQWPAAPYPDIAATWRAVTGGWRTVNGYSGYAPNYYAALQTASRLQDVTALAPFRRDRDLHVVVADEDAATRDAFEREAGAMPVARANGMMQYTLPRLPPIPPSPRGEPVRVAHLTATCAPASVRLAHDGDHQTHWECADDPASQALILDLGGPVRVRALVYSQGPLAWIVPARLAVDTSIDGIAWTPARQDSVLGELIAGGLQSPRSLSAVLPFPPRDARYVRVRPIPESREFAWFVAEIGVLSPDKEEAGSK